MKKRFCFIVILLHIPLFTEFNVSVEGKEFSSFSHTCQWGPARYPSSKACVERCASNEGFIIPGTNQLVCFHHSKISSVVRLKSGNKNVKQCGYKSSSGNRPCKPIITCENETTAERWEKCGKYTVYVSRMNGSYVEISHCGEASEIKPRTRTLDSAGNYYYYVKREDEESHNLFNCSCGFGEEGKEAKETKPRGRRRSVPNEDAPTEEKGIGDSQLHAELDLIQNKEMGRVIEEIGFLYNLIDDINTENNSNDFDIPIAGEKRTSRQMNLPGVEEIDRGKKKVPNIDESVQPVDFGSSYHHTASPNERFANEEWSWSHNEEFDLDVMPNDKNPFRDIFAGTSSPSSRYEYFFAPKSGIPDVGAEIIHLGDLYPPPISCHHTHFRTNVLNNSVEGGSSSHNVGLGYDTLPNMGIAQNLSQNRILTQTKISPTVGDDLSVAQNKRLIGNITSQYVGHIGNIASQYVGLVGNITSHYIGLDRNASTNTGVGPSVTRNTGFIGNITSQYVGLDRNASANNSEVGPSVTRNTGFIGNITSQYVGLDRNTSANNLEVGPSVTRNTGFIGNIASKYMGPDRNSSPNNIGVINPNTTSSDDRNHFYERDISAGKRYPSLWYNDSISHGSFSDSHNSLLPDAFMEMTEPAGDIYAPTMCYQRTPKKNDIFRNNEECAQFSQNAGLSGNYNTSQSLGLMFRFKYVG